MTKAKVCGNCWHSSSNGTCRKHGAPITPNSTCDSYAENPYVYDVFVDEDQFGNGSGRIVRRWGTAQLYLADVKFEDAEPHTNEPMEIAFIFQPTNTPGPNSGSTPRPIQPSEYQGCPGSHCGEFDHSGYYRYMEERERTDRANADFQAEEVDDAEWDTVYTRLDNVEDDVSSLQESTRELFQETHERRRKYWQLRDGLRGVAVCLQWNAVVMAFCYMAVELGRWLDKPEMVATGAVIFMLWTFFLFAACTNESE